MCYMLCGPVDSAGIDLFLCPPVASMLYMHPRWLRICCLGRNLKIHMPPPPPPGDLHDVYAPPGGARSLFRPELRIPVPPAAFMMCYMHPRWCGPVD